MISCTPITKSANQSTSHLLTELQLGQNNRPITFPTKRKQLVNKNRVPHFVTWGAACYLSNWLQQKGASDYLNQDANSEYKLTALGYGEPAFAAYYPNCYSVFGLCDVDPDLASMGNARNSAEFGFTMIEGAEKVRFIKP